MKTWLRLQGGAMFSYYPQLSLMLPCSFLYPRCLCAKKSESAGQTFPFVRFLRQNSVFLLITSLKTWAYEV